MAVFAFIISTGSANVTYTIELERDEKDQGSDLFRRIFFLEGKKVFFSITQQATLAKENELFCEFNHTVYLRVSVRPFHTFSLERRRSRLAVVRLGWYRFELHYFWECFGEAIAYDYEIFSILSISHA